jgi:hypothetical protein
MTYSELVGFSVSRLGLSVTTFYELTPVEFFHAMHDFNVREENKMNVPIKAVHEAIRTLTVYMLNSNPYWKKKYKKPEELYRFSWETEEPQSVEEMEQKLIAICTAFGGIDNRKK